MAPTAPINQQTNLPEQSCWVHGEQPWQWTKPNRTVIWVLGSLDLQTVRHPDRPSTSFSCGRQVETPIDVKSSSKSYNILLFKKDRASWYRSKRNYTTLWPPFSLAKGRSSTKKECSIASTPAGFAVIDVWSIANSTEKLIFTDYSSYKTRKPASRSLTKESQGIWKELQPTNRRSPNISPTCRLSKKKSQKEEKASPSKLSPGNKSKKWMTWRQSQGVSNRPCRLAEIFNTTLFLLFCSP